MMETQTMEDAELMYKALMKIAFGEGKVNAQEIAANAILKVVENAGRALNQSSRVSGVIQPLA
jgi:hypothetical protein